MQKIKIDQPMDFSEVAFDLACSKLECHPHKAIIVVPPTYMVTACEIADKWKCMIYMVPEELMKTPFGWAVRYDQAYVWSEGNN